MRFISKLSIIALVTTSAGVSEAKPLIWVRDYTVHPSHGNVTSIGLRTATVHPMPVSSSSDTNTILTTTTFGPPIVTHFFSVDSISSSTSDDDPTPVSSSSPSTGTTSPIHRPPLTTGFYPTHSKEPANITGVSSKVITVTYTLGTGASTSVVTRTLTQPISAVAATPVYPNGTTSVTSTTTIIHNLKSSCNHSRSCF
ncbi:hypothetical protein GX48_07433 [Paracoccidioides brasiliensis]|nr:hypothetical protein GX48_07433 [Paracoccidioides brasiliensis]